LTNTHSDFFLWVCEWMCVCVCVRMLCFFHEWIKDKKKYPILHRTNFTTYIIINLCTNFTTYIIIINLCSTYKKKKKKNFEALMMMKEEKWRPTKSWKRGEWIWLA
jgi:hypothetical protein